MKYILDHFGSRPDKKYCGDDPDAFPLALVCFYDKTNTDVFCSLSCAPFICAPSFLNKDCRNDDSNYMVLGYIPNLGYGKGKAKKQTAEMKLHRMNTTVFH